MDVIDKQRRRAEELDDGDQRKLSTRPVLTAGGGNMHGGEEKPDVLSCVGLSRTDFISDGDVIYACQGIEVTLRYVTLRCGYCSVLNPGLVGDTNAYLNFGAHVGRAWLEIECPCLSGS